MIQLNPMKKFFEPLFLFLLLIMATNPVFALEDVVKNNETKLQETEIILPQDAKLPQHDVNKDGVINSEDVIVGETEENFFMSEILANPIKREEDSLFGKIQKTLKADVTRTDYANFLLKDLLTVDIEKGPVERLQFYGIYRGHALMNFQNSDLDSEYETSVLDVGVMGQMKPKYKSEFRLQLKFTPTSERSFIQNLFSDVYVVNKSIPNHQIIVGNSRNQVGVEGGMSTVYLPFVMRSQISRTFAGTRALGVKVNGKYSLVDYTVAVNSSDRYFREFFPGTEFTGWVNFKPLGLTDGKYGKLVMGGGVNTGKNHHEYTVAGAYVGYNYKKFMINAEYSNADGYNGKAYNPNKADGFYTTIGYKLTPKLQLVGRYDQFDPNRGIANDLRREYSAGLNYFVIGQAMRILLNYVYCDNQNKEDSHRIILGTQLLL